MMPTAAASCAAGNSTLFSMCGAVPSSPVARRAWWPKSPTAPGRPRSPDGRRPSSSARRHDRRGCGGPGRGHVDAVGETSLPRDHRRVLRGARGRAAWVSGAPWSTIWWRGSRHRDVEAWTSRRCRRQGDQELPRRVRIQGPSSHHAPSSSVRASSPSTPPMPVVAVGGVAVGRRRSADGAAAAHPPEVGHWTLPGAASKPGGICDRSSRTGAARRDSPGRPLRGPSSVGQNGGARTTYFVILDFEVTTPGRGRPAAGDDAAAVAWVPWPEVPALTLVSGLDEFSRRARGARLGRPLDSERRGSARAGRRRLRLCGGPGGGGIGRPSVGRGRERGPAACGRRSGARAWRWAASPPLHPFGDGDLITASRRSIHVASVTVGAMACGRSQPDARRGRQEPEPWVQGECRHPQSVGPRGCRRERCRCGRALPPACAQLPQPCGPRASRPCAAPTTVGALLVETLRSMRRHDPISLLPSRASRLVRPPSARKAERPLTMCVSSLSDLQVCETVLNGSTSRVT